MNPTNKQQLKDMWDFNLTNHKPTADGIRKMESNRAVAKAMANHIIEVCPDGRDRNVALTKLEEALFYMNAAVARHYNEDLDDTPEEDKHLPKTNA